MRYCLFTFFLLLSGAQIKAQSAQAAEFGEAEMLYDVSFSMESKALGKTIDLPVHVPEEWFLTEDVDYPVLILFDSQHRLTYPFLLHAIDLLISNAQLPQMIVVGVPFPGEERRAMTTSGEKAEATAAFLKEELMPRLQAEYKAQDRPVVAGHSRTGFFTSYLVAHHADAFAAAVSLSAFFEEGFMPQDVRPVMQQLEQLGRPFSWYFASGTATEDNTYLTHQGMLRDSLDMIYQRRSQTICKLRKIEHTNHMSTYMQGLQWALIDFFSDYQEILDTWLFEKAETIDPDKALVTFAADFRQVSDKLGISIQPSIIHFWSIASIFYHRGDFAAYEQFIELAHKVYPADYSFALELGLIDLEGGNRPAAEEHFRETLQLIDESPILSESDRAAAVEEVNEASKQE